MSRITLKPLDDGQKAVEIPIGKTTIGRGPFLGCSDKKVSRNHAVLEVTNKGEVFLTPTHVNPCFYQPTADSPGQILKKDIPHKLENGDSFSLLPRAFRYQLIVTGENTEDKADQNDLNKESGKTNGAAAECEEALLNERNKDSKPNKGISNEELNDGNTVTDKPFSKEDDIIANIDKSYSKDENTFAKKIANITDDSKAQCPKEDKEINKDKESEKEKSETSLSTKKEASNEDEQAEPCEEDKDEADEAESKNNRQESKKENSELKTDDDKSKFSEKIVEENESTLGNDAFPKDKVDADHAQANDKSDSKNVQDKTDKKTEDVNASNGDDILDKETAKNLDEDEEDKSHSHSDWMESEDMPPPKVTKKRGPKPKNQVAEKKPPKRKIAEDAEPAPPKSKPGRKKAQKFNFDDEGEGSSQRNTPGRTSSRTNRQTRQGLSLEDFIVSDDDEWQSDRSSPKPRRKRGKRRGDDSGSDWEVEHKRTKKVTHKFGSGSESGSDWGSQKKKKGPKGRRRKAKRAPSDAGSDEDLDAEPPAAASEAEKKPRMACTYGKKCFRRNQNHIDQFSHPGDSDYDGSEEEAAAPEAQDKNEKSEKNEKNNEKNDAISESEEDEGSKKECPFGANCFRKNPQHKKDFKHTKKVRPKREAAKQADKKAKTSQNSDVDSYDINDSLLNDDSDEYKPADSGSDYESREKMKRFIKGKGAKNKRGKKV